MSEQRNWTKESIRELLTHSNEAVERAIVAIFRRQTEDERRTDQTKHHNGRGFCAFDARRGSYYAKWVLSGRHLSGQHLVKARKMVMAYARQLLEIAEAKQEKEMQHV